MRDLALRRSIKSMQANAKKVEESQKQELQKTEEALTELSDTLQEAESIVEKKV